MGILLAGLVCAALGAAPGDGGKPSVAVLHVEATKGLDAQTARVLTDHLVSQLRETGAFGRVVSSVEIQALIDVERQKQLMDCDTASCMTEIAGALGVELVLVASAARLGNTYLVNLRVLNTRNATAVASFAETLPATAEDVLLNAITRGTRQLVVQLQAGKPVPVAADAPSEERVGKRRWPLAALGAAGAVSSVALVVLGGGAVAAGAFLKWFINNVPSTLGASLPAVQATYLSVWTLGGLVLVVSVVVAAAGVAGVVAGVVPW